MVYISPPPFFFPRLKKEVKKKNIDLQANILYGVYGCDPFKLNLSSIPVELPENWNDYSNKLLKITVVLEL